MNLVHQGSLTGTNGMKKHSRKFKGTLSSTGGTAGDIGFGGMSETESKGSVFSRLSMTKAQVKESKESKKSAKKEVEVNFFDNSYLEPIIGTTKSFMKIFLLIENRSNWKSHVKE